MSEKDESVLAAVDLFFFHVLSHSELQACLMTSVTLSSEEMSESRDRKCPYNYKNEVGKRTSSLHSKPVQTILEI